MGVCVCVCACVSISTPPRRSSPCGPRPSPPPPSRPRSPPPAGARAPPAADIRAPPAADIRAPPAADAHAVRLKTAAQLLEYGAGARAPPAADIRAPPAADTPRSYTSVDIPKRLRGCALAPARRRLVVLVCGPARAPAVSTGVQAAPAAGGAAGMCGPERPRARLQSVCTACYIPRPTADVRTREGAQLSLHREGAQLSMYRDRSQLSMHGSDAKGFEGAAARAPAVCLRRMSHPARVRARAPALPQAGRADVAD